MSVTRRVSHLRRRYRHQLSDAAVILAALTFVLVTGSIGLWVLTHIMTR